jgi:hypothetical protein
MVVVVVVVPLLVHVVPLLVVVVVVVVILLVVPVLVLPGLFHRAVFFSTSCGFIIEEVLYALFGARFFRAFDSLVDSLTILN